VQTLLAQRRNLQRLEAPEMAATELRQRLVDRRLLMQVEAAVALKQTQAHPIMRLEQVEQEAAARAAKMPQELPELLILEAVVVVVEQLMPQVALAVRVS